MDWQLKGQGAANLVFSYCGEDANLRGQVLRIRKAAAHTASAVDQVIWSGVVDFTHDPAHCDATYMTTVIAPLLGNQVVFPGVFVPIPESLQVGLEVMGVRQDAPALILPDHTTFRANNISGYQAVGPAVCLEIKPKWGLRPLGSGTSGQLQSTSTAAPATTSGADLAGNGAAAPGCNGSEGGGAGRAEGAPKGGGAGGSSGAGQLATAESEAEPGGTSVANSDGPDSDGGPDPRQLYPRYMLHMLMKHVKNGAPFSLYNPLDMFSGESDRMRTALRRLLDVPSNNLRVFKDGAQVYGAGPVAPGRGSGGGGGTAAHGNEPDDNCEGVLAGSAGTAPSSSPSALDQLAADLADLVDSATLPPAADGSGLEAVQGGSGAPTGPLDCVVRLAVAALQNEGVMQALHGAQAKDEVGPEGALRLYEQLTAALNQAVPACSDLLVAPNTAPSDAAQAPTADLLAGAAAAPAEPEAAAATGTAVAVAADPVWAPRLEALRRYLISATAKDCGIMVTLQRVVPLEGGDSTGSAQEQQGKDEQQAGARVTATPQQPAGAGGSTDPSAGGPSCAGILRDEVTGQSYVYKVAFVDLDLKPASKIPKHVELDGKLAACGRKHAALLAELAGKVGWATGS